MVKPKDNEAKVLPRLTVESAKRTVSVLTFDTAWSTMRALGCAGECPVRTRFVAWERA